jgi:hypothetical protein
MAGGTGVTPGSFRSSSARSWPHTPTSQFHGGRGPGVYQEGPLVYRNLPEENTFISFRGYEEVLDRGRVLFWHRYGGMALVEDG